MVLKIIYIFIVLQLVLSELIGFGSFYYFVGGVIGVFEALCFFLSPTTRKRTLFFIPYLIFTFFILLINLVIDFKLGKIIMFASLLWLPLLLFLRSNNKGLNAVSFFRLHIVLSLIGAVAGIIEFYISRDLFGLVPKIGYLELYDNFSLFYRTRSIFYSTQINALFQSLSIVLMIQFKVFNSKIFRTCVFLIILFSLFLTGSRTAIVIPLCFVFLKYPFKSVVVLFPAIFFLLILILSNNTSSIHNSFIRQFDMVLNFGDFISNEWNIRFDKQFDVFNNASVFLGNGIGSTMPGSIGYINTESYYVQMFSEFGVFGLFFLLLLFLSLFYYAHHKLKPIILVMLLSGFFVHGLSSPYLFLFWVILFNNENIV